MHCFLNLDCQIFDQGFAMFDFVEVRLDVYVEVLALLLNFSSFKVLATMKRDCQI